MRASSRPLDLDFFFIFYFFCNLIVKLGHAWRTSDQTGVHGDEQVWGIFYACFLPSAMKCSGTCRVTFTVSGQDI